MRLYHVSPTYLGKNPTLVPRDPESRCETEPDTPRICVAPSIIGCYKSIKAVAFCGTVWPAMHVYAVDSDESVPARGVYDSRSTGERWLLETTKFRHVGKIPKIVMRDLRPTQPANVQSRLIREYVTWAMFRNGVPNA